MVDRFGRRRAAALVFAAPAVKNVPPRDHGHGMRRGANVIRVLIADDQAVIRCGFRIFLRTADDISVVGDATNGPQAVMLARKLGVDVVLMDVRMPGGDGLAATRALAGPGVIDPIPVIVVTTFDLDEYIFGALDAGAVGFLLKDVEPRGLVDAVRAAAHGEAIVSPSVSSRVVAEFSRRQAHPTADAMAQGSGMTASGLTRRELEIVRALARGMNNAEIAEHLHLVPGTVKTHLARISAKLGTRDRLQTAVWAFEHGLTHSAV